MTLSNLAPNTLAWFGFVAGLVVAFLLCNLDGIELIIILSTGGVIAAILAQRDAERDAR